MLYLAGGLFLLALFLFWLSSRQRRESGLPEGHVIYSDTRSWGRLEKALFDPELALTGKPDYLVEGEREVIPVEVKSGRAPDSPYDSHIYQLAAYCLLVEKAYGKTPSHGILHYPGRDFAVEYTPELKASLLDLLDAMRRGDRCRDVARSHEDRLRCSRCGFRKACDQHLG